MKKHLLALAVSAVAAAPGIALANADLYGKLNLSVDNVDGPEGGGFSGSHQLTSNKTYFGLRGDADLDHGMKAVYQFEFGVNPDRGPFAQLVGIPVFDVFTVRNSFLGFEGGFGSIKAGRMDTPVRAMGFMVDQFHDQIYADHFNLLSGEWRADNAIQYQSPEIADLMTVTIGTVAPEGDDTNGVGGANKKLFDSVSATVMFDLDSVFIGVGYDKNNYGGTSQNGLDMSVFPALLGGVGGGVDTQGTTIDMIRVVAGLNGDGFDLGLLLQEAEDSNDSDLKDFSWILSAGFDLSSALKLKAQYGTTEGDAADFDHTQATVGADYKLGAQTKTYAYATRFEVDGDRGFAVVGVGAEHRF